MSSMVRLADLCPEDKQKVAQLVKQVVELGKENAQLKAAAATAAASEEKLKQIQQCNKQAVKENCSLKNKLGQAITVLRMYHHKVQGLDAALRALQHSTPADTPASTEQQQDSSQDQQGQHQQQPEGAALPLPVPSLAEQGTAVKQDQQQRPSATSSEDTDGAQANHLQAQLHVVDGQGQAQGAAAPAGGRAADQAAGSQNCQQCRAVDSPSAALAHDTAISNPNKSNNASVPGALQQQQQCLCSKLLCGELLGSLPLPGSGMALTVPLQQLQAWRLLDSTLFAEQVQQVSQPRTVLQFDPSIGSAGGFIVQELLAPQLSLPPGSTAAATPAGAPGDGGSAAAPAPPQISLEAAMQPLALQQLPHRQQQQQQHVSRPADTGSRTQQEPQQGPGVLSAGGAATAAAAAAASSALAAVKAAAAACAAAPWQPELSSCSISSPKTQEQVPQLPQLQQAGQQSNSVLGSAPHAPAHGSIAGGRQEGVSLAAGRCNAPQAPPWGAPGLFAAVEEVPVVDMAAAPVHVLVQNEKSASSLHQAHAHVTLAAAAAPGDQAPTSAADSSQGGGQCAAAAASSAWLPDSHHWQSTAQPCHEPESRQVDVQGPPGWQQQPQHPGQQGSFIPGTVNNQVQHNWSNVHQWAEQHTSTIQLPPQQQQQQPLLDPLGPQSSFTASSAPLGRGSVQQQQPQHGLIWPPPDNHVRAPNGSHNAPVPCPAEPSSNLAGAHHAHVTMQQGLLPPAAAGQQHSQVPAAAHNPSGQIAMPLQQQHAQQQQQLPGGAAWSSSSSSSACGTRELLQKFDESLVDILAEVERLEQQQRLARQQLQQQQQVPPAGALGASRSWRDQQTEPHHHQQSDYSYAGMSQVGGMDSSSGSSYRADLGQKQALLQQRIMQLQDEDLELPVRGYVAAAGARAGVKLLRGQQQGPAAAWGLPREDAFDADDVSDILNHLD